MTEEMNIAIVVTTSFDGVYFGFVPKSQDLFARSMFLAGCRSAMRWTGERGYLGLASHGPEEGSRIGATAPSVLLHDITSVSICSDKATNVWEEWK